MAEQDSIHQLPPSPIHSPNVSSSDDETIDPFIKNEFVPRTDYLPSVLSVLRTTHRYSAYTFSAFAVIHFLNTGIAPLLSPLKDLTFADENLTAARALYQSSALTEVTVVFGSLALHVVSGTAIRIIRICREYIWYKKRAKLPTFSWNAITGYLVVPLVAAHTVANRYVPWKLQIDVTSSFVGHWIATHPVIGWIFYGTFVGITALHLSNGLSQFMLWNKKTRYSMNTAVCTLWLAGLAKVAAHGIVGGTRGRQYDIISSHLLKMISRNSRT